jgi:deferrochelatase/peroxidase EfeB
VKQQSEGKCPFTRRGFLGAASGLAASVLLDPRRAVAQIPDPRARPQLEPFRGPHQAGILTPSQSHTYFAAFDLTPTAKREDLIRVLKDWTQAAEKMSRGEAVETLHTEPNAADYSADAAPDSGEALGLPPARLTVTFGFGPGLFVERFGLAGKRPEPLADLPRFAGDQLVPDRTGGDLSVQACCDDLQVAFHAVRQLARLSDGVAQIRWVQSGFLPQNNGDQTPRNLMGFKDGTHNPSVTDPKLMDKFVWASAGSSDWMHGGTYMVVRRIRIALEHWDRMATSFQEQTIGRQKISGAPLTGKNEFDPANFDAADKDGNSIIPDSSHLRLAAPDANDGARILRRSYSYNDGVNFTAERWPPWRQGMEYDAGLLFMCYQSDPRTGFSKIFESMSKLDMMNQFVTHVGGGIFACPGGIADGEYVGQKLFER